MRSVSSYHAKVNCNNQDDWTQQQLQVILNYPDQGSSENAADPGYGKSMSCRLLLVESEIFVKYYSKIPRRLCWVRFDTKKLNGKHEEVFAPLSFVPDKEEFNVIWVQFQFIR